MLIQLLCPYASEDQSQEPSADSVLQWPELCNLLFDSSCRPPLLFLEQELITPGWEPVTPAQGKLFQHIFCYFIFPPSVHNTFQILLLCPAE